MKVTLCSISEIKPYGRNARKIPPQAVGKVAASIREFGWRQPIVVDRDHVIIAGHTRLLAAQQLGLEKAPIHVAENLSAEQVRLYRLMDNRSHDETDWDSGILKLELEDLKGLDIDLELTGFGLDEIDSLLGSECSGLTDDDEAPPLPETPVSRPGDLWILGGHRLLCGDATEAESFDRLLEGEQAHMVFCDPPYNVDYVQETKQSRGKRRIANDNLGLAFEQFLNSASLNLLNSCRGSVYICMSSSELHTLKRAFTEAGGHWSTYILWVKNTFTLGRSDYHRQYEPILYGWKEGTKRYWCGARDQGDVWFVNKPMRNDLHPTQKPVELIVKAIANSSQRGDLVLDSFGGSGSTLIGCERLGRRARLIELDPGYVDVIVRRWQDFTGREAVLERGGSTFPETADQRVNCHLQQQMLSGSSDDPSVGPSALILRKPDSQSGSVDTAPSA